jgi:hypothetical protein
MEMADVIKSRVSMRNTATKVVASLGALHLSLNLRFEQARSAVALKAEAA